MFSSLRGVEANFSDLFFQRGIRDKRIARSRIFTYEFPQDILSKRKKKQGRDGVRRPSPLICCKERRNTNYQDFYLRAQLTTNSHTLKSTKKR